MYNKCKKNLTV